METSSVIPRSSVLLGTTSESRDFLPLLRWIVLMSLTAFGLAVVWHLGIVQAMLATDRTHISLLIVVLFALTSLHCLAQTWFVSKELVAIRSFRETLHDDLGRGVAVFGGSDRARKASMIERHVDNLVAKSRAQGGRRIDQGLLLRVLADRLRSRERLGQFVSEALLRLALLGTAVGFILMLIPIAGLTSFDPETLRKALSGMSGGMAVALNITVTGIGAALLLKLQYYFLGAAVRDLVDTITEVTEVHVVSTLERAGDE